jgi:glucosamine--fructose-6-phosphate aminotransferase (isomerizing)
MSLWTEIHEQPSVLEKMLRDGRRKAAEIAAGLDRRDVRYVVVAARGSSDNAARYAQYLWGAKNRLSVGLAAPSLFSRYGGAPSLDGALVVGISQSGRSPDLLAVMEEARSQGRPTIAITNEPASPMAAMSDFVFDLDSGPERAVAATKTYTAQLLAVAMLSQALVGDSEMWSRLEALPGQVEEVLSGGGVQELAQWHREMDRCAVLGRGFNHATAFEWALKLQELCRVLAHPFSTADFQHGPVALVEPGFPILAVVPAGPLHADEHRLLTHLRDERGADLTVISDRTETLELTERRVPLPRKTPDWLSPISSAVVAQLFCHHLTVAKGLDPDSPRGLSKVTRTH